jgi:hypothetical protein
LYREKNLQVYVKDIGEGGDGARKDRKGIKNGVDK